MPQFQPENGFFEKPFTFRILKRLVGDCKRMQSTEASRGNTMHLEEYAKCPFVD
jgi:hypothetical protein